MTEPNSKIRKVQKILVDIGHPAHVHFFLNPIRIWLNNGCQVFVTSRVKEIATELLDSLEIPHQVLTSLKGQGLLSLGKELIVRDAKLLQVIRREKPDIMVGIGGVFIAHTGLLSRIPSIVFYDTENATLSNLITYPFCKLVVVPECYQAWLPAWNLRYPGYHELSYLHPKIFKPDLDIAIRCGLDPERKNFLLRTVSWQASHDLNEKGWNEAILTKTAALLSEHGKVMISAEGKLPTSLEKFRYQGSVKDIHHLMAHLNLFVGESATMASECAVLGVPAIYAATTGRGYTDEQEEKYGLVINIRQLSWELLEQAINSTLTTTLQHWRERRNLLLSEKINVAEFVADLVQNYPVATGKYRNSFTKSGDTK